MSIEQTDHIIELAAAVARIEAKLDVIDRGVNGNGQPGLKQRVEELEASNNRRTGGVAVLTIVGAGIWGFLEYVFHVKK